MRNRYGEKKREKGGQERKEEWGGVPVVIIPYRNPPMGIFRDRTSRRREEKRTREFQRSSRKEIRGKRGRMKNGYF